MIKGGDEDQEDFNLSESDEEPQVDAMKPVMKSKY